MPARKLRLLIWLAIAATAGAGIVAYAGSSNEQLQKDLGDEQIVGEWHYDDIPAGFAAARRTGRPLMLVYRCVP